MNDLNLTSPDKSEIFREKSEPVNPNADENDEYCRKNHRSKVIIIEENDERPFTVTP